MQNTNKKNESKLDSSKSISKVFNFLNVFEFISLWQRKFNKLLVTQFQNLGGLIARKWSYFIIIPVLLGCIAITGLRDVHFDNDLENLSLPVKGRWSAERHAVEKFFKSRSNHYFDPVRSTSLGHYVNLIIKNKENGGNILEKNVWNEISELDKTVLQKSIHHKGRNYKFLDVCALWKGACFSPLFPIRPDDLSTFERLLVEVPLAESFFHYNHFINFSIQLSLGDLKFDDNGILESAEAISLFYWLRSDYEDDVERARLWENQIFELMSNIDFKAIKVSYFAARTPADELQIANDKMKPLLGMSGCLMVAFAAISAMMQDAVRTKVLLSLAGIFSVVLATGSAFGILVYCKVPFIGINYAAVFLMLGIGIDDMFVFLAAWRITPLHESVEMRMRTTYGHACVSVTITSLTNVIAFYIGMYTKIRTIEIFSYYAFFSSLLTYFFFVTFFGGVLSAFGYLEQNQRHSLFCVPVKPKSLAEPKNFFNKYFMVGGIDSNNPKNPIDNAPHMGMVCIRDCFGALLDSSSCKVCFYIIYVLYIGISIFGIRSLEQEMRPDRVSFQESTIDYFDNYDRYFSSKHSFAQVVFTENVNYSEPETKRKILELHDTLEALPFVMKNYTSSWIRQWYNMIDKNIYLKSSLTDEKAFVRELIMNTEVSQKMFIPSCFDMINALKSFSILDLLKKDKVKNMFYVLTDFTCNGRELLTKYLPENFLSQNKEFVQLVDIIFWANHYIRKANSVFEMDIKLSEEFDKITASRFLIVLQNASNGQVQNILRDTVQASGIPGAYVFNYQAFINDQVHLVKSTTIVSILLTTIIVLLISFLMIPNLVCSLWVAFTIVSIELGVVGLMAIWGVKLNAVSMVNLIMCVGFSVDFSAHISYAYLNASGENAKEWTRAALYSVGLPILLGGTSTIVGVVPICFSNSSVFITFCKIVILVIVLGMIHALIYLPLFMSLMCHKKLGTYDLKKTDSLQTSIELNPSNKFSNMREMDNSRSPRQYDTNSCAMLQEQGSLHLINNQTVYYINVNSDHKENLAIDTISKINTTINRTTSCDGKLYDIFDGKQEANFGISKEGLNGTPVNASISLGQNLNLRMNNLENYDSKFVSLNAMQLLRES